MWRKQGGAGWKEQENFTVPFLLLENRVFVLKFMKRNSCETGLKTQYLSILPKGEW